MNTQPIKIDLNRKEYLFKIYFNGLWSYTKVGRLTLTRGKNKYKYNNSFENTKYRPNRSNKQK